MSNHPGVPSNRHRIGLGPWSAQMWTYKFSFLIKGVELEELLFLRVVVVGADKHDNEDGQEDSETFNPC